MGLSWAKGLFVSAFEWFLPAENQKFSASFLKIEKMFFEKMNKKLNYTGCVLKSFSDFWSAEKLNTPSIHERINS
jgi:hypothetical protein